MTYEKAVRILPSFAAHHAQGHNDIARLRRNIEVAHYKLGNVIMEKLNETTSMNFRTAEIKALARQREQLARFLEATK